MAQWISQSNVSSLSKSARSRTAYLAPLLSEVLDAVDTYLTEHPDGEEVTLAVMRAVGLEGLNSLCGDRSIDTAKQDLGLLVATTLVDVYGSKAVDTYRRDDGRAVSSRRNTWEDLPWVRSYTPHRVTITPRCVPRILLDTGVVRNVVHGDEKALDIEALSGAKGPHPVSIADGALAELAAALLRGAVAPEAWAASVAQLNGLLDIDFPVAPGGKELAALWGAHPNVGMDMDETRAYYRAAWSFLCTVKTKADLARPAIYYPPGGRAVAIRLDRDHVEDVLARAGTDWEDWATRTASLVQDLRGAGDDVTVEDLRQLTMHTLSFDMGVRDAQKLDLVVRVLALRGHQAARRREPYSPKGKPNDPLDLDLLFGLPLPAWVCTQDLRLQRLVRGTGSPDAQDVMTPEELLLRLEGERSPPAV